MDQHSVSALRETGLAGEDEGHAATRRRLLARGAGLAGALGAMGLIGAQDAQASGGGLVLLGTGSGPTSPSGLIEWTTDGTSSGALVARDWAYEQSGTTTSDVSRKDAVATASGNLSALQLSALDANKMVQAEISVQQTGGNNGIVQASATTGGANPATIIDASGNSSFLQLLSTLQQLKLCRGVVNADATISAGKDFAVARTPGGPPAGDYTITFATPFYNVRPAVVATSGASGTVLTPYLADLPTETTTRLQFYDTAGALHDTMFSFIAAG
jgi:hypothetical protein